MKWEACIFGYIHLNNIFIITRPDDTEWEGGAF